MPFYSGSLAGNSVGRHLLNTQKHKRQCQLQQQHRRKPCNHRLPKILSHRPEFCCYQRKRYPYHHERCKSNQRCRHHHDKRPFQHDYFHSANLVCSNLTSAPSQQARATDIRGVAVAGDIGFGLNSTLVSAAALATSILTGLPSLIQKPTLQHTTQTDNAKNYMMHCNVDKSRQPSNPNGAMGPNTAAKSTPEPTRISYLHDPASMVRQLFLQELLVTTAVIIVFIAIRTVYTVMRRRWARITVIVIGGGPIGLTATYIASKCARVARLVLYEELCRSALVNRLNQLAFDLKSITFLKGLGIDFDNLEGCWQNSSFATRAGIFQEYLLNLLEKVDIPMDLKFQTKFTRNHVKEAEETPGRIVVIVCDGSQGSSGRLLGISDECIQHSCNTYGAIATLDRNNEKQEVPMSEKRIHHLTFDLTSYGADSLDEKYTPGFSMKLFGSSRHRYMTLVTPKCESKCVKALRVILDRSMMRNIFMKCFNTFRSDNEAKLAESEALKNMKFSPRLFEIKLFQRHESVAYYSDPDIFILAEGDAARCYNFSTGMDVNIGIKGLVSLPPFLDMVSWAETENHITSALAYKARHADRVCREIVKHGLREYMFT